MVSSHFAQKYLESQVERHERVGRVREMIEKVWAHVDLPPYQVQDEAPKNTRSYDLIPDDAKQYLQKFPSRRIDVWPAYLVTSGRIRGSE